MKHIKPDDFQTFITKCNCNSAIDMISSENRSNQSDRFKISSLDQLL